MIYNCINLRMRRASSNLRGLDLQSYDFVLKQLHNKMSTTRLTTTTADTTTTRSTSTTSSATTSITYGETTSSTTSRTTSQLQHLHLQQDIVQQETLQPSSQTSTKSSQHHALTYLMKRNIQLYLVQTLSDISVESGILQVATNIDKKEQQLSGGPHQADD